MKESRTRSGGEEGVATLELAMLVPLLAILFGSIVQIVVYLQASTAAQYGAFVAARAYQVYGDRTLESIGYKRVGNSHEETNKEQTIAEAAAEKVIFESLLWENKNIRVEGGPASLDRYYKDGNDLIRNGVSSSSNNEGHVQVNLREGQGADVTYCTPLLFPGIKTLFKLAQSNWPCTIRRLGNDVGGIAIKRKATFGREPLEY